MLEKILLVDDEPAVLQAYQWVQREFRIDTAVGAAEALTKIEAQAYAVVVSDLRMPEMDGVQLLAQVKIVSPDTIRVMLTGSTDIEAAMNAVNEGNIFRFLAKPCNKERLATALTAALEQYRLVTAEKTCWKKPFRAASRC